MTTDPLDDIRQLLEKLPAAHAVAAGPDASPFDSAGRLADMANWLKLWSGGKSTAARPSIAIFAGAHGLLPNGVVASTDAETRAFVEDAGQGNGLISRLCSGSNIGLKVLDLALEHPTADISRTPALDARGAAATIAFGMEAAAGGNDLLCLSSVGAGGDVAASAVLAKLTDGDMAAWADPQAPKHLQMRQADLIGAALARSDKTDGLAIVADLGGREIAALCGAIIAARMERIPVVLDGLPAIAAAAALSSAGKGVLDHCRLAARPLRGAVAANSASLKWIAGESANAAPGVDSAVAVQVLRLAASA